MNITDHTGAVVGRVNPVKLAERATGSSAVTHTDAYTAEVLNTSGTHWSAPGGVRHYPTAEAARKAILAARSAPTPEVTKGLRLGANQKHELWAAASGDGQINDQYGPALTRKGLAVDNGIAYTITGLGRQVAAALFDDDGNPR